MELVIAPIESKNFISIKLPRPKDGAPQTFLYDEENIAIYEVTRYDDKFRSWFVDELFIRDGRWNTLTRVDPLFIFTPILMRLASEQFRTLQDICSSFESSAESSEYGFKMEYALSPTITWNLVCDTKELDDELFVRYSQTKTLGWLLTKHKRTMEAFKGELKGNPSTATLISYATDMIDLYLPTPLSIEFKSMIKNKSFGLDCTGGAPESRVNSKRPNEASKGGILNFLKKRN